ncbi:MAG: oligosaccharide flippase family protein, partial [Desulfatitalea sp.]|nr:oligosaccharide flippase family protein [Desulfatitalea sp.]NNJ99297.1 oligosaccharide flippase family protein [Desulfatitalea sp.]
MTIANSSYISRCDAKQYFPTIQAIIKAHANMPLAQTIMKRTTPIINWVHGFLPSHIKESQGLQRYFQNTAWLLSEKVFRLVVSLWIFTWVARYLGPTDFGLLNYAASFVMLFAALASMGVDSVLVKELSL